MASKIIIILWKCLKGVFETNKCPFCSIYFTDMGTCSQYLLERLFLLSPSGLIWSFFQVIFRSSLLMSKSRALVFFSTDPFDCWKATFLYFLSSRYLFPESLFSSLNLKVFSHRCFCCWHNSSYLSCFLLVE